MRDFSSSTKEQRDSLTTLLCDELEKGLSVRVACDLIGIGESTYHRWKRRAGEGDDEAIQLIRRLKAARARGLEQHRGLIKRAAEQGDWRAAAWLIDKLYPNLSIEEIEYAQPDEQQDDKPRWSTPDRLRAVVLGAVETGIVSLDELLAMAPKQPAPRPSIQAAADPLDRIRDAVVDELADGPRELTELRDVVCALTSCTREELEQACDGLDLEQEISQGRPTRVKLANPPDRKRTTPNSVSHEAEATSGAESTTAAETPGSQRGNWFDGPARGTGDMIAKRRS
jgi:hypothetical protein